MMRHRDRRYPIGHVEELRIKSIVAKQVGSLYLIDPLLQLMQIGRYVDEVAPMGRETELTHGDAVEALVMNRLHSPYPLYRVEEWACGTGFEELFGIRPDLLNDDRLGRALDAIAPHLEEIHGRLVTHLVTQFQLPTDHVVWDVTSLYFEGDYEESRLIRFGYSRDQKPDKKQVNVALNVSAPGAIPMQFQILAGHETDVATVAGNLDQLRNLLGRLETHTGRPRMVTMVGDRALLTSANIRALVERRFDFVGPLRMTKQLEQLMVALPQTAFEEVAYAGSSPGRYWAAELGISLADDKGVSPWFRAVIVKSEEKKNRDEKARQKAMNAILKRLDKIRRQLNNRKYRKRAYVEEQLKKLFVGPNARYRHLFHVELDGPDGELRWSARLDFDRLHYEQALDGIYVLLTTLRDCDLHPTLEIMSGNKERNQIEQRFRNLKTDLKVRPIFLHNEERIKALVFITVLALTVYSLIEWLVRQDEAITARQILYIFQNVGLAIIETLEGRYFLAYVNVTPSMNQLLRVMNLPDPSRLTDIPIT